ncbi:MAG: GatB/YqeY domain-containing protein [Patescibacteria group bacterium]|nr:GatB/YqeY domain-containing protein [Patescibacteria group bacterium]
MTLLEQIETDYLLALKGKNEPVVSVLRMLKSAMKNKEIALGKKLDDTLISELVAKEVKSRQDSINEYKKGNRQDLVEKEQSEIEILKKYLPEQLSPNEVEKIIEETIKKVGANSPQDMGKVMAVLMPQLKGKADGSLVSSLVKSKLQG